MSRCIKLIITTVTKTPTRSHKSLAAIASQCQAAEAIKAIQPLGNGNVNETFLVQLNCKTRANFVLQRLNTAVFSQPELVMQNLLALSGHVDRKLGEGIPQLNGRRWELPRPLKWADGQQDWLEENGDFWRAISYIENAYCLEVLQDLQQAQEVGFGLGMFHLLISDLPATALADTLEGFHITPNYLAEYQQVLKHTQLTASAEAEWCVNFIEKRHSFAAVLEAAKARGELQLRPIHGDPKINNLMLDVESGQAIALIDLDTVKPGLVHYDIGDCLRSGCNPLGEETTNLGAVHFDLQLCEAILEGYLSVARGFLNEADHQYLYEAIRLIPFELGLRFFSDYLNGSVYFRSDFPTHNLQRALVQFKLTESIEVQEQEIRAILERLRGSHP